MNWRGRAGEVENFVHFDVQGERHVVAHQLKVRVAHQMGDVVFGAAVEVVDAQHFVPLVQQAFAEVRAQKARTTRDHDTFAVGNFHGGFSRGR